MSFVNNIKAHLPEDIKESLNVLADNETRRQQKWQENVEKVKVLLGNYNEIRQQVVELALEVCVIHHGGRARDERYTLTSFAKDAGIASRTLQEWVRLYGTIYPELTKKQKEELSYAQLREIDLKLTREDRLEENITKKVKQAYKVVTEESPVTKKMKNYLKLIKTVKFNAENPRMMKGCDIEVIIEILHDCRDIVVALSKYDKK